jgi:hypothetical protein
MRRYIAFIVGIVIGGLFTACPKQEVKTNTMLRIQGHVYDNSTKRPVVDAYVGLRIEFFQEPYGQYAQAELANSTTDSNGLYSIQCTVDSQQCPGAKLYLFPSGTRGVYDPGIRVQCTDDLQTIDLYK